MAEASTGFGEEIVPAPTVRVVRRQVHSAMRHPLATRQGIELMLAMIAAADHWRPLTAKQRDALRAAYQTAITRLPVELPDGADHLDVETPRLHNVHPATLRSLVRRGLATADGHVTDLALHVVQHADFDCPRSREGSGSGGAEPSAGVGRPVGGV